MIAFPAIAALVALACAAFVGWDALRRPRPERLIWTIAFFLFAVAAGAEVVGALAGWTPLLARVYYLAGAVLVVGILGLGELYLLFPRRMPAITPGLSLLVAAIAATAVWSAPVDQSQLALRGWGAIERGPLLVAIAAAINAGGTAILVGGGLWSAWRLRGSPGHAHRAWGCLLIAVGAVTVAAGGTLTRFGRREYLYLAMAAGIVLIFTGVLLTRRQVGSRSDRQAGESAHAAPESARSGLIALPSHRQSHVAGRDGEGIAFVAQILMPLEEPAIADLCRRWSATAVSGDSLSRSQAHQVWALRTHLDDSARHQFDRLSLPVQAQVAELFHEVWSAGGERAAIRAGRRA